MPEKEHRFTLTVGQGTMVIPAWLGGAVLICFLLAVMSLILVWTSTREMLREIRVLQVHVADVENLMIQQNLAKREDFADWEPRGDQGERNSNAPNMQRHH